MMTNGNALRVDVVATTRCFSVTNGPNSYVNRPYRSGELTNFFN